MKVGIIIVAAGSGTRMGGNLPKQFLRLDGRSILVRTLEKFDKALPDSEKVVVLSADMLDLWNEILEKENCTVNHKVCVGGRERFFSVKNGIDTLGDVDFIGVHDAVRPLLSDAMILRVLDSAVEHGAVVPVVPAVDSFRVITPEGNKPVVRDNLRAVQTPQIFRADILKEAYAVDFDTNFTDDASVVEKYGQSIYLCQGELYNIKITNPLDMKIAELILHADEL